MIYLDNAATTRVDPSVVAAMQVCFTETFGNPSSLHRIGVEAARGLRQARETLARLLAVTPAEIVLTSGGTESDALAILGTARASRGGNVVVTTIEHPAVLQNAQHLQSEGFTVRQAGVGTDGIVDMAALQAAVDDQTVLVSVMHVNNEIGTLQPIEKIGRWLKGHWPACRFHVDAVQSFTRVAIDVAGCGIDLLSLSSHKIHGPKGAGALFVRKGVQVRPLWQGGGQESGLRGGTENVPAFVGFARAAELAEPDRPRHASRMQALRDRLWQRLQTAIAGIERNGDPQRCSCNILSVNLPGANSELLLHCLEAEGICVSAGSACHAREREPSRVLQAIGILKDRGTVRFSVSRFTEETEIDRAAEVLARVVPEVRRLAGAHP